MLESVSYPVPPPISIRFLKEGVYPKQYVYVLFFEGEPVFATKSHFKAVNYLAVTRSSSYEKIPLK